jgi:hypothetical protein
MPRSFYDPDKAPDAGEWLGLDEQERIRLARSYHEAARIKLPSAKAHAVIHAAVENQIATGFGPSCRAIERLQKEGLTRHEAIHAIGSVLAAFIHELSSAEGASPGDFQARMNTAIEALTAAKWRALADGNDG